MNPFFFLCLKIKNIINDITTPTIFPARSFISKPRSGINRCDNSKKIDIKKR